MLNQDDDDNDNKNGYSEEQQSNISSSHFTATITTTNRGTAKANRSITTTPITAGIPYSEVKKYGELRQQGILTEEEFHKLKADLLSKM
jgi:hypothetical protein